MWIIDKNKTQKGIIKFPKVNNLGTITGEYWAEKIASDLAYLLNLECARVDIGEYDFNRVSMSYFILNSDEELIEGIQFITRIYNSYDEEEFCNLKTGEFYSIPMIINSLKFINLEKDFLKIPIFDCLIGNSDRHPSNWGVVWNKVSKKMRISPLYDNGSSLCAYVNESQIDNILRDGRRFSALVSNKSKSIIRRSLTEIKKPNHFDVLSELHMNYYDDTIDFVKCIKENIKEEKVKELIEKYPDIIVSSKMKVLLVKFINERVNNIFKIYNLKEGEH